MDRDAMVRRIESEPGQWDFAVIGGGATGLGIAIDAASRGYRVVLVEQGDFAQGTSSRSTKLIHGGVRYLQQGNVSLVLEALKERGLLRQNAPHLVHDLPFVVPNYDWWEAPFYGIGLRLYDVLAGRHGFGQSRRLSREETLERLPTLETDGLRGGVLYYDGQFDDARLAIDMAKTAVDLGATLVNYMPATGLRKEQGMVCGLEVRDAESGRDLSISARVVINATGPFTDDVRRMDDETAKPVIRPSQGVHVVLPREFHPGDSAIIVPRTEDGRVLFAIPWHDRVLVGTTDTPITKVVPEPRALPEEIEFLLSQAANHLTHDPTPQDVLSVFVGIRPLVGDIEDENSAAIARDHSIMISPSALVTIAGGKWTTYRKMAEDVVDQAAVLAGLPDRPCVTPNLKLHGYHQHPEEFGDLAIYGSDAVDLSDLLNGDESHRRQLHPTIPIRAGEVIWTARREMARTVEDVLSRRTRCLLLGARACHDIAGEVAQLMARELGRDEAWVEEQKSAFRELARGYLLP